VVTSTPAPDAPVVLPDVWPLSACTVSTNGAMAVLRASPNSAASAADGAAAAGSRPSASAA
jgi:hypothetical protein